MNQEKIDKLVQLALRGVGGEMENARRILQKNGIDWEKQSKNMSKPNNVFSKMAEDIRTSMFSSEMYYVNMTYPGDPVILRAVLRKYCKYTRKHGINMGIKSESLYFRSYPADKDFILKTFKSIREVMGHAVAEFADRFMNEL